MATGWTKSPGLVLVDPAYVDSMFATPDITLPPEVHTALFYAPQDATRR